MINGGPTHNPKIVPVTAIIIASMLENLTANQAKINLVNNGG